MTAVVVAVGGYFFLAGIVAVWIGKTLANAAQVTREPAAWIPDTADEFLEVTR